MEGYPKTRKAKGYMWYATGLCPACERRMIKRQRGSKIKGGWEVCPNCEEETILFVKIGWEKYCNYMEDGALLVLDV